MPERGSRFHRIDGGYAWVITVASLLNNIIIFGSIKSGGVFLVALNVNYGVSKAKAAFIGITTFGALFGTGVFVTGIVNRFGYRPVQLLGSCVAFLGVFSSYFIKNPDLLIFTFGALQGIGYGICFLPNITIVSHYFKRYRATANGVGLSGGPLGSFLLPPLIEYLLEEYGLRGTYLIMSGVVLHMVVFSSLMLDPPYSPPVGLQVISKTEKDENHEINSETVEETIGDNESNTIPFVDAPEKNEEKVDKKELENGLQEEEKSETETLVRGETNEVITSVRYYPGDDHAIYRPTVEELPPTSSFAEDLSTVLKNRVTYLMILNATIICISVISFHITVPDFSVSGGADLRDAAFIISMSSIADFFSRILLGCFIDRKYISISASYMLTCFIATIAFLVLGIAGRTSYSAIMGSSIVYGVTYGVVQIHQPVMTTHYIGLRYLTITMSLGSIVSAIFSFVTSPIANEFMDSYGSYMGLYIMCGAIYFLNGLLWAIVICREGGTVRRRMKFLPKV